MSSAFRTKIFCEAVKGWTEQTGCLCVLSSSEIRCLVIVFGLWCASRSRWFMVCPLSFCSRALLRAIRQVRQLHDHWQHLRCGHGRGVHLWPRIHPGAGLCYHRVHGSQQPSMEWDWARLQRCVGMFAYACVPGLGQIQNWILAAFQFMRVNVNLSVRLINFTVTFFPKTLSSQYVCLYLQFVFILLPLKLHSKSNCKNLPFCLEPHFTYNSEWHMTLICTLWFI